jgi:hypothetical protein
VILRALLRKFVEKLKMQYESRNTKIITSQYYFENDGSLSRGRAWLPLKKKDPAPGSPETPQKVVSGEAGSARRTRAHAAGSHAWAE